MANVQDKIMGIFEIGATISWALNIRQAFCSKGISGVSKTGMVFWVFYGLVQIYFATVLCQWLTVVSCSVCEIFSAYYFFLMFKKEWPI